MHPTAHAYNELFTAYSTQLKSLNKQLKSIAFARLLSFAIAAIALIYGLRSAVRETVLPEVGFAIALVSLALFLFFVRKHALVLSARYRADARCAVVRNELAAMAGDDSVFDRGYPAEAGHQYASDLDLFGADSLYQHLNRCHTAPGLEKMRKQMLRAPVSPKAMPRWHDAVKSLETVHRQRVEFIAAARNMNDEKGWKVLAEWSASDADSKHLAGKAVKILLILAPICSLGLIAAYVMNYVPETLLMLLFMVPLVIAVSFLSKTGGVYKNVGKQSEFLRGLESLMSGAFELPSSARLMRDQQEKLNEAKRASAELARILSAFDQRNNIFAAIVTNALYLSDLRSARKAILWRRKYGASVKAWIEAIADLEVMVSLGTFAANHSGFLTYPEEQTHPGISARGLIHPLMLKGNAVPNDFELNLDQRVMLITGANMAGKSTFLRAVGANVLLAQMGAPVTASFFSLSKLRLFTAMRTADDLSAGTSYFMAELKRLAALTELKEKADEPVLALLDEILKGTNSADKEAGSRAFVEQLRKKGIYTLVATHDVSLCSLADTYAEIVNYFFAAEVKHNDLYFDYKLRAGICNTMNATWLMRKMGIIQDEGIKSLPE